MPEDEVPQEGRLPSGDFSEWLDGMRRALRGKGDSDVPCMGCTACCTSSQFVLIGPDEADTLAHIPGELLFPAPRSPKGTVVLGYDENGYCPMLGPDGCSIYAHRFRACRTYDCRVFSGAGVEIDDEDQVAIARRARRWRFDLPGEIDQVRHEAVRVAARYVHEHRGLRPDGSAPLNPTERAVVAIRLHGAFMRDDEEAGGTVVAEPEPATVWAVLRP